jgi:hypothetical protein
MFLLGNFGVRVEGVETTVTALPEKVAFGSITNQGMPFYGAAVTYELPLTLDKAADVKITANGIGGTVADVRIDGEYSGVIAYAPYTLTVKNVEAGEHTVYVTVYLSRVNCFGALHDATNREWKGPNMYFTSGAEWTYEYNLKNTGLLRSPKIEIYES